MCDATWIRISVPCVGERADAVAAFLGQATGRGVVLEGEGEKGRVVAYVEPERAPSIIAGLDAFTVDGGCGPVSATEVPEEDWMAVFRAQHERVAVSGRLAVRPTWCPAGKGLEVVVDPGLAFGTGSHPTTRLCLVLLDEAIGTTPPCSMLDLGTGTGVLAIACVLLGVKHAVAIDIDPVAAQTAKENAARNGAADRVEIVCGDAASASGTHPLVAANLSTSLLLKDAAPIAAAVRKDGRLVLSGILKDEMEDILAAFAAQGLAVERRIADGEWEAALLSRTAEGAGGV